MSFEIIGDIQEVEAIAIGPSIRELRRLRRQYGRGRWRKGIAHVRLRSGRIRLAELHWYEAMRAIRTKDSTPRFVVCIDNSDYEASLELHKIYSVVPDPDAAHEGDLRIVDESGEDYLYESKRFLGIEIPKALERVMLKKAS